MEKEVEQKTSKLAIVSFVLGAVSLIMASVAFIFANFFVEAWFLRPTKLWISIFEEIFMLLSPFLALGAVLLGINGLVKIFKNTLFKGKIWGVLGIIFGILSSVLYITVFMSFLHLYALGGFCRMSDPPACPGIEDLLVPHYLPYPISIILITVFIYWFLHRKEENSFNYITEGVYGFLITPLYLIMLITMYFTTLEIFDFLDISGDYILLGSFIIIPILGMIIGYKLYKHTNKIRWKYALIFSTIFIIGLIIFEFLS